MMRLKLFEDMGLRVSWKLIDLGFKGEGIFRGELAAEDIIAFALAGVRESEDPYVAGLACAHSADEEDVDDYIKILSHKEDSDYATEFRKLRVAYVKSNLPDEGMEYVRGLLALGDIWCRLGFPHDSPHVFHGKGGALSAKRYYSEKNYKKILAAHISWVDAEIAHLAGK